MQSPTSLVSALVGNVARVNDTTYVTSPPRIKAMRADINRSAPSPNQKPVLDSAATHHLLPNTSYFSNLPPSNLRTRLHTYLQTVENGIENAMLHCANALIALKDAILCFSTPIPLISASNLAHDFAILISKNKFYGVS